jgi:hypothetical protein
MQHKLFRLHEFVFNWRHLLPEELIALVLVLFVFISPASAAMRFQERSLYMNSTTPSATASYTVSFRYMSPQPVGSVEMLFCVDPIPYHECVTPPGMSVSSATLSQQTGETDFALLSKSTNRLVISRSTSTLATANSSYRFDGIKNPSNADQPFSLRFKIFS